MKVRRLENTVARLGGDGDNWHMTWTSDDRMVAGLCDGSGESLAQSAAQALQQPI